MATLDLGWGLIWAGKVGSHLARHQARGPGQAPAFHLPPPGSAPPSSQHPAPAGLPARTSRSAGGASSAHTATAPGPRAAAAGGGAAHRAPPCTLLSPPSSGPQAGPPHWERALQGPAPLSHQLWAPGSGRLGVALSPTPPGWSRARFRGLCSRMGREVPWGLLPWGLTWIRGSRAAQRPGEHKQEGGSSANPPRLLGWEGWSAPVSASFSAH